jgi:hypoxia up-regulated 1
VRMPKIQQQLKEYFGGKDLGVHLNGDEAMALGAAFRGANLSNAFRVRQVGMTDIATFPVGVRLVDLDSETVQESEDEDSKQWVKRASLFSETHRLGLRKAVSFMHTTDIACTFRYDKPSILPEGVNVDIATYKITGIKRFSKDMQEKNLGEPKVTLSFELDSNGIARIAKAEVTVEEEYEVEVEVKKPKKDKKKKASSSSSDADAEEEADESEAEEPKEFKKEMKKRTHREALEVTLVQDKSTGKNVLPMSADDKKTSMKMLRDLDLADKKRQENLEAKNRLESFIYHARDALTAKEDAVKQVTIPEQLEQLEAKLEETEDWLYDDGDKVDAAEYNKKVSGLEKDLDAILFRVDELKELPIAFNVAKEYAFSTRELVAEWVEAKPQITDEERQDVLEKVEELEAWLVESEEKQTAHPRHETPKVTSNDVAKKVQGVKKFVNTLSKKPVPASPKDETSNDTATDAEAASEEKEPKTESEPEQKEDADTDADADEDVAGEKDEL